MRIQYHYCLENKWGLEKFLNTNEISYEKTDEWLDGDSLLIFDLYEDEKVYTKFKIHFPYVAMLDADKSVVYSKEDIQNAEWLTVRSKGTKVQWIYNEKAFNQQCPYKRIFIKDIYYRHLQQTDILEATKRVHWGRRQYFSGPATGDTFLFCSERAKSLLNKKWAGLSFYPVKKYRTQKMIDDLYQLYFSEVLSVNAICGGKKIICRGCGRELVYISSMVQMLHIDRQHLKDTQMVYTTGEVLTMDSIHNETFSLYVVPQEFYQFCDRYEMNRGMVYEPI